MKTKPARSLWQELARGQIIITFLILGCCILGFFFNDHYLRQKSGQRLIQSTSSVLIHNLIASLTFHDIKDAQRTLEALHQHPFFRGALIVEPDTKKILVRYPQELNEQKELQESPPENHFSIMNDEGSHLGDLILLPRSDFKPETWLGYIAVSILTLLFGIALSHFLLYLTTRSLADQMRTLLETSSKIRNTGNYSLRTQTSWTKSSHQKHLTREIMELSEEFDQMLETIELRDDEIRRINTGLESIIEQRSKELQEAQAGLIHSSRLSALGEMSAGLAHEINNPLSIILGKASQAKRQLTRLSSSPPESVLQSLETIENTSQRIAKIIRGLKSYSRDGTQDPLEVCRVKTIIDDALSLCSSRLTNHGVELRILPFDEQITLKCRPSQLEQVLVNLMNNAHDAVESLHEKWIEIEVKTEDQTVSITVTDSGPGIPPPIRSKLMQPFFTTKGVGKGTGLGLSISRGILESHGGSLGVDESHHHTRFVMKLPLESAVPGVSVASLQEP